MASRPRSVSDTRIAKALSHPLRVQILDILDTRVASPSELSRELEKPLANVVHHVHTLLRYQFIEEVRTREKRGAIEHFYTSCRRMMLMPDEWAEIPSSAREMFESRFIARAIPDLRAAIETGTFSARLDRHMSWTPLTLDEQAWAELVEPLKAVLELAIVKEAESIQRLGGDRSGGEEVRGRLTLLFYEGADPSSSENGRA